MFFMHSLLPSHLKLGTIAQLVFCFAELSSWLIFRLGSFQVILLMCGYKYCCIAVYLCMTTTAGVPECIVR